MTSTQDVESFEAPYDLPADPAADRASHAPDPDIVHGGHGYGTNTGISNTKLGMWLFLGSECLLFGGLITTYLLYKIPAPGTGVGPQDLFDIPFTSISSFVLLMSSLTMVLAVSAIERADYQRFRTWISATALLGAVFISGQVYEFQTFLAEGMGYTTNRSSSAFYTLTGFHGVHVSLGIVMLVSVLLLSFRGHLNREKAEVVEVVGLYWHFVDVVWILIFAIVYLIP